MKASLPRRTPSASARIGVRGRLAGWLAILCGALPAVASPQAPGEGPLRNQTFVPVDERAADALARGDALVADDPTGAANAWFEALAGSGSGAVVPLGALSEEPDAPAGRAFEGVEEAVLRRLADPATTQAWRAVFGELADERLGNGRGPDPLLMRVERRFPTTTAALRAALVLGDRALARGEVETAELWYRRAQRHQASLPPESQETDTWRTAFERRTELLATVSPAADLGPEEPEPTFRGLVTLFDASGPRSLPPTAPRGSGIRVGLAPMGANEVVLQSASRVHVVDLARGAVALQFEPSALVEPSFGSLPRAYGTETAPDWLLRPAVAGRRVALVVGRTSLGTDEGNALAVVEVPRTGRGAPADDTALTPPLASGGVSLTVGAPQLLWALNEERRIEVSDGVQTVVRDVGLEPGAEFQPGPLFLGGLVVAAVREGESELSTRLLGLDAATGRVRWSQLVCVGAERRSGTRRLQVQRGSAGAATPLLAAGGSVFLGTQTGAGTLVDAVDGRVRWTVLNRRRDGDERGWTGQRSVAAAEALAWAPADSDFLYHLPLGPLAAPPASPFSTPPVPVDAAFDLAGAVPGPQLVLLADAGSRQALAVEDLAAGGRYESLHLFPGEPLRPGAHCGPRGVYVSTDRALYRFDPGREMLLTHRVSLPPLPLADTSRWQRGGPVQRLGNRLLLLETLQLAIYDL